MKPPSAASVTETIAIFTQLERLIPASTKSVKNKTEPIATQGIAAAPPPAIGSA